MTGKWISELSWILFIKKLLIRNLLKNVIIQVKIKG